MQPSPDDIRVLFHSGGLRHTRQRELVYAALAANQNHPTAEEIHSATRALDAGLSLATVYNTLDALTEAGLCRTLAPSGTGPCRYDANTADHVHVSSPDGRVIDVPEDLSRSLLESLSADALLALESRLGVRIGRINVQLVASRDDATEARATPDTPAETTPR